MGKLVGDKYGIHRVIEPQGVLTQAALKIDNDMTHEEAYDILSCTGIFHDFCTDEYEQEEVTEQFVAMCNGY